MQKMQNSSIQTAKENQGDDALKGPPMRALPYRAVDEPRSVARHAPSNIRINGTTKLLEEKTMKIPAFVFNGMATKATNAITKGQQILELVIQGKATEKTAGNGQEKGETIVVRDTGGRKRKRQHDPDDDPDL